MWPDPVAGLGIAAVNAGAAHVVDQAARGEHKGASKPEDPQP